MLPYQPNDELVFGTSTTSDDRSSMEGNIINFSSCSNDKELVEKSSFRLAKREKKNGNDIRKVIMHREVERKRRQEMSNLFVDLKSCIPLELGKGKRSVCDDTTDYIKLMQKNVLELRIRRDMLKKVSNLSISESSNGDDNLPADCVIVNHILDGVEILVSHSVKSWQFGISRILAELQQNELNVVSCVSTRVEEGFLHKIHVEARDMTGFDVSVLQDRLINVFMFMRLNE